MRKHILVATCAALALAGCQRPGEGDVERAIQDVLSGDENSLNEIMMNVADPGEAVTHFRRTLETQPDSIAAQRGLARSLVRAGRNSEAVPAWARVTAHPEATHEDRVEHADALIRAGEWKKAEAVLQTIPPTHETYRRYRLEAMVADANKQWAKADSFYETAAGLTTRPSGVLNNWGFSKLTRGDFKGAERLFTEAIRYDPSLFTAKNNLVLARGAQRNYDLPVVQMTPVERAQLYHTLALTAIKQGDVSIGKGLLQEAIDAHPQHFDPAVRALQALEARG
ncbi:tetratricopeptide repeat protein [Rhodovulum strictum]|uniref:Tetratricopeptide repeat protein n=1 Tax=Rhodovulum strictum TaxID=58314 RepID=A0A844B2Z9_9RHOB|nr:tetratricopeptide repeat protein [Rhodovulum strictum]MRH20491.1 tetratricopeptide repeat protein [Rhodovulum strictum]